LAQPGQLIKLIAKIIIIATDNMMPL